jgi:hypothetical protein
VKNAFMTKAAGSFSSSTERSSKTSPSPPCRAEPSKIMRRIVSGYSAPICCAITPPSEKPATSNRVKPIARQNATHAFVSAATFDGVWPDDLPIPG